MKNPHDLTHDQLAQIVSQIQDILYRDSHSGRFDCDREWSGADICQDVATLLEDYDLLPLSTSDSRE